MTNCTFGQQRKLAWPALLPIACLMLVSCRTSEPVSAQDTTDREQLAKAADQLRDAQRALNAGKFDEASQQAREAAEMAQESADLLQASAEILYRSGNAKESLSLFDRVVKLTPQSAPYNWQRGIALCNCGEWEKGAAQFKTHHDVNPDDVENSAWYFLCVAKTKGLEAARKTVIPSRGDGRQPMMSVLKMLKGEIEPDAVVQAGVDNTPPGLQRARAQFYADLYVGLYYDCLDESESAQKYLQRSLTYGNSGYMVDVARVYLADRFPQPAESSK